MHYFILFFHKHEDLFLEEHYKNKWMDKTIDV